MQIKATNKPLRIDFRVEGKVYSENLEGGHRDDGQRSTYPFDSAEIQPGQTWEGDAGTTVVRVVELGGAAAQDPSPTAP